MSILSTYIFICPYLAGLQMGLYAECEAEEVERSGWDRSEEEGGGEARSSLKGESSLRLHFILALCLRNLMQFSIELVGDY